MLCWRQVEIEGGQEEDGTPDDACIFNVTRATDDKVIKLRDNKDAECSSKKKELQELEGQFKQDCHSGLLKSLFEANIQSTKSDIQTATTLREELTGLAQYVTEIMEAEELQTPPINKLGVTTL